MQNWPVEKSPPKRTLAAPESYSAKEISFARCTRPFVDDIHPRYPPNGRKASAKECKECCVDPVLLEWEARLVTPLMSTGSCFSVLLRQRGRSSRVTVEIESLRAQKIETTHLGAPRSLACCIFLVPFDLAEAPHLFPLRSQDACFIISVFARMSDLGPLAMSQTKEDLLNHLSLPPQTYDLMSKETDRVYQWLISDKSHLKDNCKRSPPYDWSDIKEGSKDMAMNDIICNGDPYTQYYWEIGRLDGNWVAKWFLYHKFRYRDGRNRSHQQDINKRHDKTGKRDSTTGASIPDQYDDGNLSYRAAPQPAYGSGHGGKFYDPVRDV
ncbi:unnamed protein product [Diplocarpon coronariae]